jgi:hypothetical protein
MDRTQMAGGSTGRVAPEQYVPELQRPSLGIGWGISRSTMGGGVLYPVWTLACRHAISNSLDHPGPVADASSGRLFRQNGGPLDRR